MATRSTPPTATAPSAPNYVGPFITVAILFLIFGFITNLNMALVPHLRNVFTLPYAWAMLAESAFFLAYFVFATPTSMLIQSIGYKKTMVVSLFIQVVGCLLFVPAAKMVSFPLFLTAVFVVGAGVTALQTAANPYVAILGPEHSAPARLTLAQALNSVGGTIAPLVAGAYILTDPAHMQTQAEVANTVRGPYIAIAGGLLILGLAVMFMHLPQITQTQEFRPGKENDAVLNRSIWSYRHTVLAALGIFLYVGVEVGLASISPNYFKNLGVDSLSKASFLVSLYWGGALIGRLLGSWMLTKVKAGKLLGIFGVLATVFVFVSMATQGQTAIYAVVICGFFNSIMFPNIFALGIAGLGPMTSKGSGLIMTAVVGGAIVPPLIGYMADKTGSIHEALIIPAICYFYIAFYGFVGSHPKRTVTA
ncbi:sugar MFS transporter [Occallatibacter riparius]|uniref:Sugar MFS transporter n=1 Tax=Occallatibacter riparius TaxID=1002689 RepID=A0A9J7BTD7_9BACT|nr:sugar MFS transporter [Occallatibacter riparius]UWZ85912.1 sugar MFS transporter [Occallatibacter riparius]